MEVPLFVRLQNVSKYGLSSTLNAENSSLSPDEHFLRKSATPLPISVNVFISNLLSNLVLPPNSTEPLNSATLSAHNRTALNLRRLIDLERSSLFNGTDSVSLTSVLNIIPSLTPALTTEHDPSQLNILRTPGDEGWMVTLVWSMLFYPMVVLAAAGNILVIWIIATKPLMRTVMNRYLLNLSLSDFLTVTFNASFNFVFMLNEHWPFGRLYCVVNNFITNLTIASSVCTIMFISLDRYYAIVHPLRPRQSQRRLLFSIGLIWFFSFVFSIPTLLYSETLDITYEPSGAVPTHQQEVLYPTDAWITSSLLNGISLSDNGSTVVNTSVNRRQETRFDDRSHLVKRTLCMLRWPDGDSGFSTFEFLYNLAFLVLFYLVPLLTMVVALVLMSRVLWPGERIGEHTTLPQHALIRSKRKVVCMLICVITVFAVCWLPYHSYFISIYLWPSLIQTSAIKHIFLAFYWFAMANSLFNPIILFAMNRRIRNYIIYYLKFTCCLFGMSRNYPRKCHRSSLQGIKKATSQMNYAAGHNVNACNFALCNQPSPQQNPLKTNGPYCGTRCASVQDRHSNYHPSSPSSSMIRKSNNFSGTNGECSSSSNQSCSIKRKLIKSKNFEKQYAEISTPNHSCPPILFNRPGSTLACLCCERQPVCQNSCPAIRHCHHSHSTSAECCCPLGSKPESPYSMSNTDSLLQDSKSQPFNQNRHFNLLNTDCPKDKSKLWPSQTKLSMRLWMPFSSRKACKHRYQHQYRIQFGPNRNEFSPDTNTAL